MAAAAGVAAAAPPFLLGVNIDPRVSALWGLPVLEGWAESRRKPTLLPSTFFFDWCTVVVEV